MLPVGTAAIDFEKALLSIDRLLIQRLFADLSEVHSPVELVEGLIVPALEHIGSQWEQGTVSLSQVYMSGRMCEELVDTILPPAGLVRRNKPKMAIAILEDYHVLGKRIIYSALRASGFELLDYGPGLPVDQLVTRAREDRVKILLISVLMLPSALLVKQVSDRLKAADPGVKIVVGGAPFRFDKQLWREVGADATGDDSGEAIRIVSRLVEEAS